MSFLYDDATNLLLGNPSIIPLSGNDKTTDKAAFDAELSKMILSASGWRKVFAVSGDQEDPTPECGSTNRALASLIADSYCSYIKSKVTGRSPVVAVGLDARPTGAQIADVMLRVLTAQGITVRYLFITAAPEIMAYSHKVDGFVYISASHNPIGHNGIKFGLNDGGVIPGSEASILADMFRSRCAAPDALTKASDLVTSCKPEQIEKIYKSVTTYKKEAVETYRAFTREVVSGETDCTKQDSLFNTIKESSKSNGLSIVCDMNGSARTLSIDSTFLPDCGLKFFTLNDKPRQIVHAIIPEPENLIHCAAEMTRLQKEGHKDVLLGYMPDCDGDRGNIVYWNEKTGTAEVLKAQEVFALSVLAESASLVYSTESTGNASAVAGSASVAAGNASAAAGNASAAADNANALKAAVCVNDPTSMRIEEITGAFGFKTFRAEVGEANVVNLAREKRQEGYTVRILGEGSNGGNITHPAAVRDPLNTIFALIKLLVIKDSNTKKGLFHIWCELSGQQAAYKDSFTLADIIDTLPSYTTTGVSEKRAVLKINTRDHGQLKAAFQKVFIEQWESKKASLAAKYGFASWEAICNNSTKETRNVSDFSISGKGGLKVLFKDKENAPLAYIWMRGSGTEPVFRVLCDVKGRNETEEKDLLAWETEMLALADRSAE